MSEVAEVHTAVSVPLDPTRAFALFLNGMNSWWPPEIHVLASETCTVSVEPRPGGRWFERSPAGDELDWGKVLVYEPPSRLVLSWQLLPDPGYDPDVHDHPGVRYDPALLTEVETTFSPRDATGTFVALEHRKLENLGTGIAATEIRELLAGEMIGWPAILGQYARFAEQEA